MQADTPNISPIATMQRVARDFVIVTFAQQIMLRRASTMQSHLCVSFLRSRLHNGTLISLKDCNAVSSDFTFPEDARWNAERQSVEFGVGIGEARGMVRVPRRIFQRLLPERPTPERRVEGHYLERPRFETIAVRKLRGRQLTEDGNVEISGPWLALGAKSRHSDHGRRTA